MVQRKKVLPSLKQKIVEEGICASLPRRYHDETEVVLSYQVWRNKARTHT
jgi:hypothetical protein